MVRLACLVIGYLFGLIQTGYFYGRLHHVDIQKEGSGNVGTTNAFRTMGAAAGIITFLGDAFKCILAVLLVHLLFRNSCADMLPVLSMYTGLGVVLGHNYPFFLHFKGGKGIAVTAGLIASTVNFYMMLLCLFAFLIVVALTRYVSIGSLVVVVLYAAEVIIYGQMGGFGVAQHYLYEMYVIAVILVISAFYKHKDNIQRLRAGTENKWSVGHSRK